MGEHCLKSPEELVACQSCATAAERRDVYRKELPFRFSFRIEQNAVHFTQFGGNRNRRNYKHPVPTARSVVSRLLHNQSITFEARLSGRKFFAFSVEANPRSATLFFVGLMFYAKAYCDLLVSSSLTPYLSFVSRGLMPNFFIRSSKVLRFTPRRNAAPFGPLMRPLVS